MSFWKWFSTKFHSHEWVIHKEEPIVIYRVGFTGDQTQIRARGVRYTLRCKICGELKLKSLI